jgi:O-antigen/teichoic acid export membrane protein
MIGSERSPFLSRDGDPMSDVARTGLRIITVRALGASAGLAASIVIARAIGPTGRGLYAFPIAFLGVVMAVSNLGLEHANIFLAGRGVGPRELWADGSRAALGIGALVVGVVVAAYMALGPSSFGGLPFAWIFVAVVQVPLLLQVLYRSSALQIAGSPTSTATAATTGAVVHVAITLALYTVGAITPFRVVLLTGVANLVAWATLTVEGARAALIGADPRWSRIRRAITFGVRAHAGLVFFFLLLRVDQLLVQRVLGYHELGIYALAVTLAELVWLVSDPFAISVIAHQVEARDGRETWLAVDAARLGVTVAATAGVVAWVAAPFLIRLLYGPSFAPSVWPFRMLLPGVVALAVYRPLATALLRQGRATLMSVLGFAALVVNVGANAFLLPLIGVVGASVASSVVYVALATVYVRIARTRGIRWSDIAPRRSDVRLLLRSVTRG